METKTQPTTTKCPGVCEKVFNALHLGPAFRQGRRISHRPHDSIANSEPTAPTPPSAVKDASSNCPSAHAKSQPKSGKQELETKEIHHAKKPMEVDSTKNVPSEKEAKPVNTTEKKKFSEVIHTNLEKVQSYLKDKEKSSTPSTKVHSTKESKSASEIIVSSPAKPPLARAKDDKKSPVVESEKGNEPPKSTVSNINAKVDDYLNRVRNKLKSSSTSAKTKSNTTAS